MKNDHQHLNFGAYTMRDLLTKIRKGLSKTSSCVLLPKNHYFSSFARKWNSIWFSMEIGQQIILKLSKHLRKNYLIESNRLQSHDILPNDKFLCSNGPFLCSNGHFCIGSHFILSGITIQVSSIYSRSIVRLVSNKLKKKFSLSETKLSRRGQQ